MPIYNVKNKKTGEVKEIFCSYDEKKKYLKDNPDWVSELSAPKIGEAGILSGTNSRKHATGFRDVLERVKTKNSGSNLVAKIGNANSGSKLLVSGINNLATKAAQIVNI